MDSMTIARSQ